MRWDIPGQVIGLRSRILMAGFIQRFTAKNSIVDANKMHETDSLLPTFDVLSRHLGATAEWLLRSIKHGKGGSCAHYSPVGGWSRPYPETTGYLIPTLIELQRFTSLPTTDAAIAVAKWLRTIQNKEGFWCGGLHPPKAAGRASVFNTGQILKGMVGLYRSTGDGSWLDSAHKGAKWLAMGVSDGGVWTHTDYRSGVMPSYYTEVAWPMLEIWRDTGDAEIARAAKAVLGKIVDRCTDSGEFEHWGFETGKPAYTHTIAYTIRGLQECARILGSESSLSSSVVPGLEVLLRFAELRRGRLPGAFTRGWAPISWYSCLTGNAQVALCLLIWEQGENDLRIVNAAAKLVEYVCSTQLLRAPAAVRGAVAGSSPPWGRYMTLRYPNWAAKYHCDAVMLLWDRLRQEVQE